MNAPARIGLDYGSEQLFAWIGGAWVPLLTAAGFVDAPSDGNYYARRNAAWAVAPAGLGDAPSDSFLYGRDNAAWSSGGTMSGALTVNGTLTGADIFALKRAQFPAASVTANGATAISRANGEVQRISVTANATLSFTNWPAAGQFGKMVLDITNTGSFVLTWPSSPTLVWANHAPLVLTPSGRDLVVIFSYDAGSTFLATIIGQNYG